MNCPICNGEAFAMGNLGTKVWLRCQNCGMEFSREVADTEDEEESEPYTKEDHNMDKAYQEEKCK